MNKEPIRIDIDYAKPNSDFTGITLIRKSKFTRIFWLFRRILGTPILLVGAYIVYIGVRIAYGKETASDKLLDIFPIYY